MSGAEVTAGLNPSFADSSGNTPPSRLAQQLTICGAEGEGEGGGLGGEQQQACQGCLLVCSASTLPAGLAAPHAAATPRAAGRLTGSAIATVSPTCVVIPDHMCENTRMALPSRPPMNTPDRHSCANRRGGGGRGQRVKCKSGQGRVVLRSRTHAHTLGAHASYALTPLHLPDALLPSASPAYLPDHLRPVRRPQLPQGQRPNHGGIGLAAGVAAVPDQKRHKVGELDVLLEDLLKRLHNLNTSPKVTKQVGQKLRA